MFRQKKFSTCANGKETGVTRVSWRGGRVRLNHLTQYPQGVYCDVMIADLKKRAVHRSHILQGQMKGLEKMIEKEAYCMDIVTQSLAIQKSLGSLNKLIIGNHLLTHTADGLASGKDKLQAEALRELLDLYELSNVRGK